MNNVAVLGADLGDGGKGRVVFYLSKDINWTVKFGGGSNAGHTFYHNGKKIINHLVPCSNYSLPQNKGFLGAGMVVDPEELLQEIKQTETFFPGAAQKIFIDPDMFVVFPKHIEEDKNFNNHIGSTNKGITPAYRDKIGRIGTKFSSLIRDNAEVIKAIRNTGAQFKYVLELQEEMEKSNIIFEGSQSIQLDLNFSNYPFCTSGECSLGGIFNSGFAFASPKKVYGVAKGGYTTRAGGGDGFFGTEMPEAEAEELRTKGNEFGSTTKRPRRIGYMDLPSIKFSCLKGGINALILSKLDILNGKKIIKVAHKYSKPIRCGSDFSPGNTPEYIELPGWNDATQLEQILPFIESVENVVGVPVEFISCGVNDEDIIKIPTREERKEFQKGK